jgi:HEAT repeat protein
MNASLTQHERRLLRAMQSTDPDQRESAALSLNGSAHQEILNALRLALTDPATNVSEAAAQSLALIGDRGSAELVVSAAERSVSPWPRPSLWAAVQLATVSGDPDLVSRVDSLLDVAALAGPEGLQQAILLRAALATESAPRVTFSDAD